MSSTYNLDKVTQTHETVTFKRLPVNGNPDSVFAQLELDTTVWQENGSPETVQVTVDF